MTYKDYSVKYHALGFNIACLSYLKTKFNIKETNPEKAPCHSWVDLQIREQKVEEIDELPWNYSTGIGCIIGKDSVKCIDIDDCSDKNIITDLLKSLNLPSDYEWVVKTNNGFHIYIKSDELYFSHNVLDNGILSLAPNSGFENQLKRIELRWAGHCILPPSKIYDSSYSFYFKNEFPNREIEYVNLVTLFQFLCKICGTAKYSTVNSNNLITDFRGELKVDDYIIKIFPTSDSYYRLKQFKNDTLVYSAIQTMGRNWIAKGIYNPENIIYVSLKTTGLVEDELDYESYPRINQFSYIRESKNGIEEWYYNIKSNSVKLSSDTEYKDSKKNILNSTEITSDILLSNLSSLISESASFIFIFQNKDYAISILDSEYLRIAKKNPFREIKTFCTLQAVNNISSLNELYEFLFREPLDINNLNSLDEVRILRKCYKLMELYGFTR